ncbi:thiamine pyrophosphate-dependent enzyme [Escherichia coli]
MGRLRDVQCRAAPDVCCALLSIRQTTSLKNSGGLGTMGFGLPAALGVKMALQEETVVCVTGDGGLR